MSIFKRHEIEEKEEWEKWTNEIPFIKWPPDWEVKAVPPSMGAIIRYQIKTPKCAFISVYLDCYDRLGWVGKPYWEVYPHNDGECFRCLLKETDLLIKAIGECSD